MTPSQRAKIVRNLGQIIEDNQQLSMVSPADIKQIRDAIAELAEAVLISLPNPDQKDPFLPHRHDYDEDLLRSL